MLPTGSTLGLSSTSRRLTAIVGFSFALALGFFMWTHSGVGVTTAAGGILRRSNPAAAAAVPAKITFDSAPNTGVRGGSGTRMYGVPPPDRARRKQTAARADSESALASIEQLLAEFETIQAAAPITTRATDAAPDSSRSPATNEEAAAASSTPPSPAAPASPASGPAPVSSSSPLVPHFGSSAAPTKWSHPKSDITTWYCGGGFHIDNRTCVFHNLCFDSRLRLGESNTNPELELQGEDRGFWVIFDPSPDGAASKPLRDVSNSDPARRNDIASLCSVRRPEKMFHPHRLATPVPWAEVGYRITEKTVLLGRHQPTNFAHSMQDDWYALYWMLRTHYFGDVASETDRAARKAGVRGETDAVVTALPVSSPIEPTHVRLILHDQFELQSALKHYHYFAAHAPPMHPHHFREQFKAHGVSDAKPYVCFDTIALGNPGVSMQRNEGYMWEPTRTWHYPIDTDESYRSSQQEFGNYVAKVVGGVAPRTDWKPPTAGSDPNANVIVVSQRKLIYKGNRLIMNLDALLTGLRAANLGYPIVVAHLYNMTLADQIHLARRTILMVGPHGHGNFNTVFMRRGTSLLELVPTRIPEMYHLYEWISKHMNIIYEYLPFLDAGGGPYMDMDYDIDVPRCVTVVKRMLERYKTT